MEKQRREIAGELESGLRKLNNLQAENSLLKSRISEMVSGNISPQKLADVENFQHRFLRKDELIALARKDIDSLQKHLDKPGFPERYQQLRNEINELEKRFGELRAEFWSFGEALGFEKF